MTDNDKYGHIKPQPHTQAMWDELAQAKAQRDYVRVGKLSADIRTATIRGGNDVTNIDK